MVSTLLTALAAVGCHHDSAGLTSAATRPAVVQEGVTVAWVDRNGPNADLLSGTDRPEIAALRAADLSCSIALGITEKPGYSLDAARHGPPATVAFKQVVRPDGVPRLIFIESFNDTLTAIVCSLPPTRFIKGSPLKVLYPQGRPITFTQLDNPIASAAIAVGVSIAGAHAVNGKIDFSIDNSDSVTATPNLGWVAPGPFDSKFPDIISSDPPIWAPAGRPADWAYSIHTRDRLYGQANLGLAFADNHSLWIVNGKSCDLIDPLTCKLIRSFTVGDPMYAVFTANARLVFIQIFNVGGFVFDTATGKKVSPRISFSGETSSTAFAPDGRSLIVSNEAGLKKFDVATGSGITSVSDGADRFVAMTPATFITVTRTGNGDIAEVRNPDTLKVIRTFPVVSNSLDAPTITADSKTLLTCGRYQVAGYDLATGRQIFSRYPIYHDGGGESGTPIMLPGGHNILIAGFDSGLYDTAAGTAFRFDNVEMCFHIAVSPDGRTIARGCIGETIITDRADIDAACTKVIEADNIRASTQPWGVEK